MEYKRFGNDVVIRLDIGDEICESVLRVAKAEKIALASVSGIGATNDAVVGVFNMDEKTYNKFNYSGTHEITSLTGNLTAKDGEPYSHLHITLAGENGKIAGGHLLSCVISITAEIFIRIINGEANRKQDEKLGINKMDFGGIL